MLLIREKPERPPSIIMVDGERGRGAKLTFCETVKRGIKNRNYILLLFIMFFMVSTFISFATNIDELLNPPFNTAQISGIGLAVSIVGLVASFLWGLVLKKYKTFVLQIRVYCFVSTIFYILIQMSDKLPKSGLLATVLILSACFSTPVISSGIAYANEVTYPLDETIILGFTIMLTYG